MSCEVINVKNIYRDAYNGKLKENGIVLDEIKPSYQTFILSISPYVDRSWFGKRKIDIEIFDIDIIKISFRHLGVSYTVTMWINEERHLSCKLKRDLDNDELFSNKAKTSHCNTLGDFIRATITILAIVQADVDFRKNERKNVILEL